MTQQYYMTSSPADFLCLSNETIVTKSIFRVNMYVILFLLNLQWLMTNTVSQNHNGRWSNESPSLEFAGTENDLNHILSTFVDSEDEINNFSTSNYVAMADIQSIF